MTAIQIDFSQLYAFFDKLRALSGKDLKNEFKELLEAEAVEFLGEVAGQVGAYGAVDTGLLIGSFEKGGSGNIWEESGDGYKVGSNVHYAKYVNDGHHTRGGGRWIEGRPFWDDAVRMEEERFAQVMMEKFTEIISNLFG